MPSAQRRRGQCGLERGTITDRHHGQRHDHRLQAIGFNDADHRPATSPYRRGNDSAGLGLSVRASITTAGGDGDLDPATSPTAGNNSYGIYGSTSTGGPIAVTIQSGHGVRRLGKRGRRRSRGRDQQHADQLRHRRCDGPLLSELLAINGHYLGNITVSNFGTVRDRQCASRQRQHQRLQQHGGRRFSTAGAAVNLRRRPNNVLDQPCRHAVAGGRGGDPDHGADGQSGLRRTARRAGCSPTSISPAPASDQVNVSGTANLAGAVQVQVSEPVICVVAGRRCCRHACGTTNNGAYAAGEPKRCRRNWFIPTRPTLL